MTNSYAFMMLKCRKVISFACAQRLMVWCRVELRSDFLSGYTDLFYEPQTFENF